ncbi:hypothetical protein EDD86DRAFT_201630 [Gorgonomyces haynaldii]|nr:hypothetical protein EDD86DRAFT_201630 [Gorgonomyces haynaldii]
MSETELSFVEIASKRLRNFRKKLAKIEKYESQDPSTLDKDQLAAVQKKEHVLNMIKEFEEVQAQLVTLEQETEKKAQVQEKKRQGQLKILLQENAQEVKLQFQEFFNYTLQVQYCLGILLPSLAHRNVYVSPEEFHVLSALKHELGFGAQHPEQLKPVFGLYEKLYEKSHEEFTTGFSFQQVDLLLHQILYPPAPPKFGLFNAEPQEEEPEIAPAVEVVSKPIRFFAQDSSETIVEEKKKKPKRRKPKQEDVETRTDDQLAAEKPAENTVEPTKRPPQKRQPKPNRSQDDRSPTEKPAKAPKQQSDKPLDKQNDKHSENAQANKPVGDKTVKKKKSEDGKPFRRYRKQDKPPVPLPVQ